MKIVLIDDEVIIVNGIKKMIMRLRNNVDDIHTFTESDALFEFFKENTCDLLITDIRMEDNDGFRVIEKVKTLGKCNKFAIISGYDYFSYAKKSIEVGVVNYILKPIEESELFALIEKVEKEIEQENKAKETTFIKDVINGHVSYQEAYDRLFRNYSATSVCVIKSFDKEEKSVYQVLCEKYSKVVVLNALSSIYYVVFDNNIEKEEVKKILLAHSKNFAIVSDVLPFNMLNKCYEQCKRGAIYRPLYEDKGVLFWADIDKSQSDTLTFQRNTNELFFAVKNKDREKIILVLKNIFDKGTATERLYSFEGLLLKLNKAVDEEEKILMHRFSSCNELINHVTTLINKNAKAQAYSDNALLDAALNYIEKNYAKDITLARVANEISVNYYYLSRLFKNEINMNFKEYLTQKRLSMSLILLKDVSNKIYDVAKKCGYNNVNIFNEAFKKHYGVTPMEFRRLPNN